MSSKPAQKKRATLPKILRKHSLVSVYTYPMQDRSLHKFTKIGEATIIERKRSKDTQGNIKYWDVTLKWVVTNAAKVAALKGLASLPRNMQEVIMQQALPKHSHGYRYPNTINVEYATSSSRNSIFRGYYVSCDGDYKHIVFGAASDTKDLAIK